jgi:serine O-acetyltransferase
MGVVQQIIRDTLSLARSVHGERRGPREIAETIFHDGTLVLALSRLRAAADRQRIPVVGGVLRRLQVGLFGADIARDVQFGEGVRFSHTVGIVIGGARIGDRVQFLGGNTIGCIVRDDFPQIGNDVIIGAGARIFGAIRVGDGAMIGANAVVASDVPARMLAIGNPARLLPLGLRRAPKAPGAAEG